MGTDVKEIIGKLSEDRQKYINDRHKEIVKEMRGDGYELVGNTKANSSDSEINY